RDQRPSPVPPYARSVARWRWGAALATFVLAAAACGSTVPRAERPGASGNLESSSGLGPAQSTGGGSAAAGGGQSGNGEPSAAGTSGSGSAGGSGGLGGTGSTGGGDAGGAVGSAGSGASQLAPGVTATTIYVGVVFTQNGEAANKAI